MSTVRDLAIGALREAYASGDTTPRTLLAELRDRAAAFEEHNIWIHLLSEAEQDIYLTALEEMDFDSHPLWGIPFAIKDNIDLAGIPTTAACEAFSYRPDASATVVARLVAAGAIPVGKTNLDQFATGLNGTRSPFGPCRNAFDPRYISGGSSSGSAVAVALGLASFSLGTDTAGSGRVPACFNNLVGLKPSRGLLPATGMVPACRSLDCMTVFAFGTDDAEQVLAVAEGFDAADPYSRHNSFDNGARHYGCRQGAVKCGVLAAEHVQFFGDEHYARAWDSVLAHLRGQGVELVEIDYAPFDAAARLLYEGPWVAERYLAVRDILHSQPEAVFPVVRDIIAPGAEPAATTLFEAQYRLQELRSLCQAQLAGLDCLLTPTAGRCFTVAELQQEPVLRNSQLGYYTNFMNLLDMAALAVPAGFADNGLPFGVTLSGPAFRDRALLSIANRLFAPLATSAGATGLPLAPSCAPDVAERACIDVLVCGAHLDGQPLNWQLRERGAVLRRSTHTAPCYRLYALPGGPPERPALVLDETGGAAIEAEIWAVPAQDFGSFVAGIPAPLGIGSVLLPDGSSVSGFICEPRALDGARDITALGGWRSYLAQRDR